MTNINLLPWRENAYLRQKKWIQMVLVISSFCLIFGCFSMHFFYNRKLNQLNVAIQNQARLYPVEKEIVQSEKPNSLEIIER